MLTYRFRASPRSHVPAPHADCAGMPWGHRRCPSIVASSTEDHLAEGGCCVDRRLIVVCFLCCRRQRGTSGCPRRSPGDRRCRRTLGRARRRGRRGWLLCCSWLQYCPASKILKSRCGPFLRISRPPAPRLSTPIAIGSGRPWCGGLPFPLRTGGRAMRPCRLIVILAAWPILLVLSGLLIIGGGFRTKR